MLKIRNKNIWVLHLTVLIWGFTGILGVLIQVSSIYLVWYRVLIASLSLLVYFLIRRKSLFVTRKQLLQYVLTGAIVGAHWILFFESIKTSTVSITLVCLSSVTLFTAVLEPIFKRQKISPVDILVGLVIIIGIYLIFTFEANYIQGIIYGIIAAFLASCFSIINSKLVSKGSATTISFYEMTGAFFWISIYMAITNMYDSRMNLAPSDLKYLLLLGTVCTATAYVLAVVVMKELSAFTVALTTNLEPVYGIILAWIFFGTQEKMSIGFYAGAVIVLGTVFSYPYVKKWYQTRKYSRKIEELKS
ncbi:DMT family transporter [Albibacterium indicum]|uniref:DMT family transporter n=1 Tax=Albibacterium indicum TaxID=2292082 RepID=UPI000E4A5A0B|nr:DMT family transporter [Pedobacter indicus]